MIGQIESYDPNLLTGVIKSDGTLYTFHKEDWVPSVVPDIGDEVSFDTDGTIANNINLLGVHMDLNKAVKSRRLASALAFLFGWAGVSRFYLGFYSIGITQIIVTVLAYYAESPQFAPLWGFLESILIFGGHIYKDAKGRPLK